MIYVKLCFSPYCPEKQGSHRNVQPNLDNWIFCNLQRWPLNRCDRCDESRVSCSIHMKHGRQRRLLRIAGLRTPAMVQGSSSSSSSRTHIICQLLGRCLQVFGISFFWIPTSHRYRPVLTGVSPALLTLTFIVLDRGRQIIYGPTLWSFPD